MCLSPKHYAKLAWIPHICRTMQLSLRAVPADDRDTAAPSISLEMLGLNGLFHDGVEAVGWFEDGRGWLRLKGASEWNGMFGAIAIVPRVEGSSLQLQSRLQVPFIPVVLLMPFAVPLTSPLFLVGVLFSVATLVGWLVQLRRRANTALTPYLDALERRAEESLARAGAASRTSDRATLRHD